MRLHSLAPTISVELRNYITWQTAIAYLSSRSWGFEHTLRVNSASHSGDWSRYRKEKSASCHVPLERNSFVSNQGINISGYQILFYFAGCLEIASIQSLQCGLTALPDPLKDAVMLFAKLSSYLQLDFSVTQRFRVRGRLCVTNSSYMSFSRLEFSSTWIFFLNNSGTELRGSCMDWTPHKLGFQFPFSFSIKAPSYAGLEGTFGNLLLKGNLGVLEIELSKASSSSPVPVL